MGLSSRVGSGLIISCGCREEQEAKTKTALTKRQRENGAKRGQWVPGSGPSWGSGWGLRVRSGWYWSTLLVGLIARPCLILVAVLFGERYPGCLNLRSMYLVV